MADNCGSYVSAEDLQAAKQSILHIEHVATSKDAQGNPALSVTDTIRGNDVTNTTLDGLFSDIGFKPVNGSFEDGGTINNRWETLLLKSNGSFYQWMGALPKVVPAGSTPASTGGISPTTWVDRSDLSLRSQLSSSSLPGTSLVKHSNGETVQQLINRVNRCLLSSFNGDLQQALNSADKVLIDQDYNLSSVITVNSGNSIECINGSVINHTGGKLKTAVVGSPQYWRDVDGNRQIAITSDVASGATQITVSDASTIFAGQKLLLKNGYCDMWRVLETSTNPRVAVDTLTYRSEIVEVISKSGNTLTVSKTKYAYPVTVTTYGYLSDENALSDYNGYTRPSVSKILYTDIKLKLDVVIPSTNTSRLIEFAYIDGLDLSADIRSSANVQALMQIQSSIVNIHDLKIDGHTDVALWVMETSQGNLNNLRATNWKGGSDTPFCALNLSPVVVSNVYSESSVIYGDSSAFYLNTSDGGSVTGVKSKNLGKVIDLSFSRGCVASDAQGDNADFAFGSYCSSKCIMSNGVISGYCALTSSSGDYKASLIQPAFTTDCVWQNVKRYGDQGYGSIFINNVINAQIDGLFCPQTLMFTIIGTKAAEPASGYVAVNARNCNVGKFTRISNYYDSADEFGYFYPKTKYHNISVTGAVDVGGECGQTDSFDFYTNSVVTLGKNILGINISGHVNSLTCASANKAQCYPFVGNLKMEAKPASGVFNSVDSQISGGSNFSTAFMNGALISDVYSRKTYVNSSNKGTAPTWLLT